MCVLRVSLGSPLFEDVGRQLPTDVVVRYRPVDPRTRVGDHVAAGNHSRGDRGIAPQLDTLVVGCGSSAALGGDAESTASDIKARCRQSVTRQHVVGGIGIIAGEWAADLAVQIAVRENSTGSVAKICQHARGHDTDPGDEPSSTQIAAPIAADRQVQARLVEVLSQREPTE